MLVYFDAKDGRGGGQVVLEGLLSRSVACEHAVGLVMSQSGRNSIDVPPEVRTFDTWEEFAEQAPQLDLRPNLISNAQASLPAVLQAARHVRRSGLVPRTTAIVHNYGSTTAKSAASWLLLRKFDDAVVVEPGLLKVAPKAHVPAWLSVPVPERSLKLEESDLKRTKELKCFARPDKSKGLHLLPAIFRAAEQAGLSCSVALGDALEGDVRYESKLRSSLQPWLVEGRRGADWLAPGDIFIIPSVTGEAACLSAQEALARGAFVVASRIGLMPYLSPLNMGIRTFKVNSVAHAASTIRSVTELSDERFSQECKAGISMIRSRDDLWYQETLKILSERR